MTYRMGDVLKPLTIWCAIAIAIVVGQGAGEAQTARPQGQPPAKLEEQPSKEASTKNWWEVAALADANPATPTTVEALTREAEAGDRSAQFRLGTMYLAVPGGVSSIREKGIEWLKKAAAQGHQGAKKRLSQALAAESTQIAGKGPSGTGQLGDVERKSYAAKPWDVDSSSFSDKPSTRVHGGEETQNRPSQFEDTRATVSKQLHELPSQLDRPSIVEVNSENTRAQNVFDSTGSMLVWVLLIASLTVYLLIRRDEKLILLAFAFVAAGMMLYPPFHVVRSGTQMNMGYGFLFDPPKLGSLVASVNVAVLLTQWVVTILVCAVGWILTRQDKKADLSKPSVTRQRNPESKSMVEGTTFVLLRLFRVVVGLVFGWQIIGLFPVATWVANPSAITVNMVAMVVLKIAIGAIAGMTFFGIRKYTNWLHKQWFGIPHPALSKAMSL